MGVKRRFTSVAFFASAVAPYLLGDLGVVHALIVVDTVPVGNAGNAPDPVNPSVPFGAVSFDFHMGKTEITNTQYAAFLNAKAASDPLDLYNPNMGFSADPFNGGIGRSGSDGSYSYFTHSGRDDWPVILVTWYDALRFTNWMHNGQGDGNTETGAYTLLGGTPTPSNGLTVTRNPGARWWLPSDDEWYKAAYHKNDGVTGNYYRYPASSDTVPFAMEPPGVGNTANFLGVVGERTFGEPTDVGSYTTSPSPYGTFDQGGNVWEWTELLFESPIHRLRGGYYFSDSSDLISTHPGPPFQPTIPDSMRVGFRVASEHAMPIGYTADNPFLPDSGGGGDPFVFTEESGDGHWFDPPSASGFLFQTDGNSNFVEIGLPPLSSVPDGDGQYLVSADIGQVVVSAGSSFIVPGPVDSFTITGIDPLVDGGDPLAFPTWLVFDQSTVNFTMTPIGVPKQTGPLLVQNAGFEHPGLGDGAEITGSGGFGWDQGYYDNGAVDPTVWFAGTLPEPGAFVGVWNVAALTGYPGEAFEGQNHAYSITSGDLDVGLSQILIDTLHANTEYVLEVEVGNPLFNGSDVTADYRLELLAGDVVLATVSGASPTAGVLEHHSLTFYSGASPAQLGERLAIRLIAVDGGISTDGFEVDFDLVTLTATSADFNSDGIVNGKDFLALQVGLGIASGASLSEGDANGDGAVDALDLSIWEAQFSTSTLAASSAAVPEPTTSALALAALCLAMSRRRAVRKSGE